MKQRTTVFLKSSLFIIVVPILGFFIFVLPWVMTRLSEVIQVSAYLRYPGLIALYAAVGTFLFTMYQTIKLILNIIKNKGFSKSSEKILVSIKYSTGIISVLYVIAMPLLYILADKDDAPGIILFGFFVAFVTGVSAVYTAVFEKNYNSQKSAD